MTTQNQCQFWDCTETTLRKNDFLCKEHYSEFKKKAINKCQRCERYKLAVYSVCRSCNQQSESAGVSARSSAVQQNTRDSHSASGGNGHATAVQSAATTQDSDPRKRYNAQYRTSDGHYVRSRAEVMIDDWLFNRHIAHAYERKLPVEEDALCDFYLPQGNVYIEFWGKEGDPAYACRMREKQEIYKRHNLQLISLTDDELYLLDDRMPSLLRPYGVGVT